MERILTTEQMRNADKYTIEKLGVCQDELVYRAGSCVAEEIINRFRGGRVLVCVGKGNNGADGKIVAEILSKKHGFSVLTLNVSNGIFKLFDKKFDIIVDCIFGTGLNKAVEGKYKVAIEKINSSGAYVIACDIPSGLNGDSGLAMGVAVKANLTIAIQEYKIGHFINDGPDYCGVVVAKDIGISIWGDDYVTRLNSSSIKDFFPKRKINSNKGDYGKTCVIGGSKRYSGSVLLSANAFCSLKMGVGYTTLVVPESLFSAYLGKVPECILSTIPDIDGFFVFNENSLKPFLEYDSIAIGMGVGVSENVYKIISFLIKNYKGNLLIDADGINSIAKYGLEVLKQHDCNIVLTPHIGEFARLINADKTLIINDCVKLAKDFAKEYGVTLLLKSNTSIITDGEKVLLNTTGTPAMAKAGSGDVLSGLTVGLLARNNDVLKVSAVSAFIFGKAGEYCVKEVDNEYTIVASDLINSIPKVISKFC